METLTIEIKNNKAFKELEELERLHLIKVTDINHILPSNRFKNCLPKDLADELNDEISKSRIAWNAI